VLTRGLIIFYSGVQYAPYKERKKNNMEHTTFLQANGDLIGFLIFVVIPLVLVMVLVIKNPQTALSLTLSLIKAVFKLLVSAGKFIAPFIMPFLAWLSKTPTNDGDWYSYSSYSSDDGFSTPDVDKVRTYQNGVDGPKRNPGTTFYH
jgi:hypothetical protein